MDINIYILCYNEMQLLPFTLKFYKLRFPSAKITIFDNMSSDGSSDYAENQGCKVVKFDTNNLIK